MKTFSTILSFLLLTLISCTIAQTDYEIVKDDDIVQGAERSSEYFPMIQGKTIGIVANHTSYIGEQHILDYLLEHDINVVKVFSPEHGFRGNRSDGAKIEDGIDPKTKLPVISLYGKHRKPTIEDFSGLDYVMFDIQDVGTRFYTYISTMHYVMEAAAENDVKVIILDRPNPNGFYVDGPVLDTALRSFVGMHPIPIVHGMTVGELALMINGEGWLDNAMKCDLTIVPIEDYHHKMLYQLPIKPSPNLPTMNAVYLYPSLCLFEGTIISVGRGTDYPFEVIGHPDFHLGSYIFTPTSRPGASRYPKHKDTQCNGQHLGSFYTALPENRSQLFLNYLLGYYEFFKGKDEFFTTYFEKLAGSKELRKQIEAGMSEIMIRNSWEPELEAFKKKRKTYLLYPDF